MEQKLFNAQKTQNTVFAFEQKSNRSFSLKSFLYDFPCFWAKCWKKDFPSLSWVKMAKDSSLLNKILSPLNFTGYNFCSINFFLTLMYQVPTLILWIGTTIHDYSWLFMTIHDYSCIENEYKLLQLYTVYSESNDQ